MFKSWRSDKNKIKAVFKLQFQATQVPRLKKSAVMISLVPDDVGKPTFRLEKVAVQDGTCLWENPVYVTVKLIRDSKTGKINEKIYHFIVATGSSKSGFLGEASIDFADFAAEIEPLTVSLPLKFANSGAILHVTIERMQGDVDPRNIEENGDMTLAQVGNLKNQQSNYNTDGNKQDFAEDQNSELGSFRADTGSSTTLASFWDNASEQNTHQDPGFKKPTTAIATKPYTHQRSNTDLSVGSNSDGSLNDYINSPEDNLPRQWQEASDGSIEALKFEIANMKRQVNLSELELQSLRKQVVKESKRAQDQTRQIVSLSEERDALEAECAQLRKQNCIDDSEDESQLQSEIEHLRAMQEEIRQVLNHEKEMNTNLRLQLQKTQDSNSELILAVEDLNDMLEKKNREISSLTNEIEASKFVEEVQETSKVGNMTDDEQQLAPEESTKEQNDENEVEMLKQKIIDQEGELEFYRKHAEELELHIKQLTEDYEVLQQEYHNVSSELEQNQLLEESMKRKNEEYSATIEELVSQVESLEDKIKQQSQEYSESLIDVNELESQVKELKRELEKQAQEFEDDLDAMTRAKTEQEQRAIRAEESLRKTRWKNAATAERLQEEFKRLSVEMSSKFDENEKMSTKALTEANELRAQKTMLEEMLQKAKDELEIVKDQNGIKLQDLSNQIDLKEKQIEKMSLELDHKSKQLEYVQNSEGKKDEASSMEIQKLRTEIEKLKKERYNFSEQAKQKAKPRDETKQMRSIGETDELILKWKKEKAVLEKKLALAKKEAEKAHEELISIRSLKDEKNTMDGNLQSELENLKVKQDELKSRLIDEQLEKDNLRKQVFQLKDELLKKEEEITSIEKEFKNNGGPAPVLDVQTTASLKRLHKEQSKLKEATPETSANSDLVKENNDSITIEKQESSVEQDMIGAGRINANVSESKVQGYWGESLLQSKMSITGVMSALKRVNTFRKEEPCSEKEPTVPASHTSDEGSLAEFMTEMTSLKEKNKRMETELKEMQERYSEISLKFAEVEGERQQLVMTVRNLKNAKKN